jgi:hypothetical protein
MELGVIALMVAGDGTGSHCFDGGEEYVGRQVSSELLEVEGLVSPMGHDGRFRKDSLVP